jgi:hypothetical protein
LDLDQHPSTSRVHAEQIGTQNEPIAIPSNASSSSTVYDSEPDPSPHNNPKLGQTHEPSPDSEAEAIRRKKLKILREGDWLGLELQKPIELRYGNFNDDDREAVGKRRKPSYGKRAKYESKRRIVESPFAVHRKDMMERQLGVGKEMVRVGSEATESVRIYIDGKWRRDGGTVSDVRSSRPDVMRLPSHSSDVMLLDIEGSRVGGSQRSLSLEHFNMPAANNTHVQSSMDPPPPRHRRDSLLSQMRSTSSPCPHLHYGQVAESNDAEPSSTFKSPELTSAKIRRAAQQQQSSSSSQLPSPQLHHPVPKRSHVLDINEGDAARRNHERREQHGNEGGDDIGLSSTAAQLESKAEDEEMWKKFTNDQDNEDDTHDRVIPSRSQPSPELEGSSGIEERRRAEKERRLNSAQTYLSTRPTGPTGQKRKMMMLSPSVVGTSSLTKGSGSHSQLPPLKYFQAPLEEELEHELEREANLTQKFWQNSKPRRTTTVPNPEPRPVLEQPRYTDPFGSDATPFSQIGRNNTSPLPAINQQVASPNPDCTFLPYRSPDREPLQFQPTTIFPYQKPQAPKIFTAKPQLNTQPFKPPVDADPDASWKKFVLTSSYNSSDSEKNYNPLRRNFWKYERQDREQRMQQRRNEIEVNEASVRGMAPSSASWDGRTFGGGLRDERSESGPFVSSSPIPNPFRPNAVRSHGQILDSTAGSGFPTEVGSDLSYPQQHSHKRPRAPTEAPDDSLASVAATYGPSQYPEYTDDELSDIDLVPLTRPVEHHSVLAPSEASAPRVLTVTEIDARYDDDTAALDFRFQQSDRTRRQAEALLKRGVGGLKRKVSGLDKRVRPAKSRFFKNSAGKQTVQRRTAGRRAEQPSTHTVARTVSTVSNVSTALDSDKENEILAMGRAYVASARGEHNGPAGTAVHPQPKVGAVRDGHGKNVERGPKILSRGNRIPKFKDLNAERKKESDVYALPLSDAEDIED